MSSADEDSDRATPGAESCSTARRAPRNEKYGCGKEDGSEAPERVAFVVEDVEDGDQLRNLQNIGDLR